jgi:hypothetical protein
MNSWSPRWASWLRRGVLGLAVGLAVTAAGPMVQASDHDDGETNVKARNRNITDVYAFREDWQTGNAANSGDVVIVMNTNPRSLGRQQYFFDPQARYNIFITQVADETARPVGVPSSAYRFRFGAPNASGQQAITMTHDDFNAAGQIIATTDVPAGVTTAAVPGLGNPNPDPVVNPVTVEGSTLSVFAGLREDPFFFDVEQYFRVRAAILGLGPAPTGPGLLPTGFRDPNNAIDFAKGYNVNAIVVRIPIAQLNEGNPAITTFDVWETIEVAP